MTRALHETYRPKTFSEVIGHKEAVAALKKVIDKGSSHAFLFAGNLPGVGKTSLARITARSLGCEDHDILEIPAAVYTGVEDMRSVQETIQNRSFSKSGKKALIIDECARLSKNAWDSLLKAIEEPPDHAYWCFCTTDLGKVPATIKSRCTIINMGALSDKDIAILIESVISKEKINVSEDVVDFIVSSSGGSARQALVYLALCDGVNDRRTAAKLMQNVVDSDPVLELCRFLVKGGSWMKAMSLFSKLEQEPPESCRIVACRYIASSLKVAKGDKEAIFLLQLLDAFGQPFNPAEGHAPLLLAMGKAIFNRND